MENSAHWCIPTGAHTSSADGGCPDTQGSTSRKQQALSKCRLFPGLKSLDPALPFWGPELRAILEGSSVGREWLGQAGRNSPQGLTCECSGKEGWRKGGAGTWARRAGALALQAGPSSVEEPAARGLKMPLFQLSTQEAWEGGAGSCAALVPWTQLPARPSPSLISVPFSCSQSLPASGSFPVSWLFVSGGQSIGALTLAAVLPMNILTGLVSLLPKGVSRVFSSIAIQKCQFFGAQTSFDPTLMSVHDLQKNCSFDYMDLSQQSTVSTFQYAVWVCHNFSSRSKCLLI